MTLSNNTYRSACIYFFAKSTGFDNISYCSQISNSKMHSYCSAYSGYQIALKTGNTSYCSAFDLAPNSSIPISSLVALTPSNISSKVSGLSYTIANVSDSDLCYYSVALYRNNITDCNKLSGDLYSECTYAINQTALKLPPINMSELSSKCNATSAYGGYVAVDACIIGFAVSYHNQTYCTLITNSSDQSLCVSEVENHTNSST